MKIRKNIIALLTAAVITAAIPVSVLAIADNPYIIDKTKDRTEFSSFNDSWWCYYSDKYNPTKEMVIETEKASGIALIIPDKVNGNTVIAIKGSIEAPGFIVNPENEYMTCVDNVVFTKDKKQLMSYAQFDPRTEYTIPEGTEKVLHKAFAYCDNLEKITIPESLTELDYGAFFCATNLKTIVIPKNSKLKKIGAYSLDETAMEEICFPSFDISINRAAFSDKPIKLTSYVQPEITKGENELSWEKIPKATYYEVYQKIGKDEYKLLKTTKATSCIFPTLKSGKDYTFAVKPIAIRPAAYYNRMKDEGFTKTFTIEGTMSEDIVLTGK
ncbi:MAG: leucine-rich repeat domain-containing protein [Oscillospiraceae bacterium]|nr:leucine-rich repeat domain-containing protein [Oscillospiraceae bacterium]